MDKTKSIKRTVGVALSFGALLSALLAVDFDAAVDVGVRVAYAHQLQLSHHLGVRHQFALARRSGGGGGNENDMCPVNPNAKPIQPEELNRLQQAFMRRQGQCARGDGVRRPARWTEETRYDGPRHLSILVEQLLQQDAYRDSNPFIGLARRAKRTLMDPPSAAAIPQNMLDTLASAVSEQARMGWGLAESAGVRVLLRHLDGQGKHREDRLKEIKTYREPGGQADAAADADQNAVGEYYRSLMEAIGELKQATAALLQDENASLQSRLSWVEKWQPKFCDIAAFERKLVEHRRIRDDPLGDGEDPGIRRRAVEVGEQRYGNALRALDDAPRGDGQNQIQNTWASNCRKGVDDFSKIAAQNYVISGRRDDDAIFGFPQMLPGQWITDFHWLWRRQQERAIPEYVSFAF